MIRDTEILGVLGEVHPSPLLIKSIAKFCKKDPRTVKKTIDRLEGLGLIELVEGMDGRAKFYRLSLMGKKHLEIVK